MICPARRSSTREGAEHYRIEPYVTAGDIASAEPHRGKGGWSWYTGAAAWTWRLGVEGLLGITWHDGGIRVAPSLPGDWPGYRASLRRGTARIEIEVERADDIRGIEVEVDGAPIDGETIEFPAGEQTRKVHVRAGTRVRPSMGVEA